MYHAALESSLEMAKNGSPYSTFKGSPASKGLLQFDMWKEFDSTELNLTNYDWML